MLGISARLISVGSHGLSSKAIGLSTQCLQGRTISAELISQLTATSAVRKSYITGPAPLAEDERRVV